MYENTHRSIYAYMYENTHRCIHACMYICIMYENTHRSKDPTISSRCLNIDVITLTFQTPIYIHYTDNGTNNTNTTTYNGTNDTNNTNNTNSHRYSDVPDPHIYSLY